MRIFLCFVVLILPLSVPSSAADSNLAQMLGTLTACDCQFFLNGNPFPCGTPEDPFAPCGDWICFASFEVAAPAPHYDEGNPTVVNIELVEQAIGQCNTLKTTVGLPRKVQALYWMEAAGIDFVHGGIVRSPAKSYFLIDSGPN